MPPVRFQSIVLELAADALRDEKVALLERLARGLRDGGITASEFNFSLDNATGSLQFDFAIVDLAKPAAAKKGKS